MARFRTTKIQLSGYKLVSRRLEEAVIRRDTRLFDSPFNSQSLGISFGVLIIALVMIAGAVMNFMKPPTGVAGQTYVVTKDGGQYVKYAEAWHPVTNAVSASLILGAPVSAKSVSVDALKKEKLGLPMGIASAPAQINPDTTGPAAINVCSTYTPPDPLDTEAQTVIDTSVLFGDVLDTAESLTSSQAVLVTVYDKSRYWVLFDGKRAVLDVNDNVMLAALNIDIDVLDRATIVSPKLLDTIPAAPALRAPNLTKMRAMSEKVTGIRVGTVLVQEMPNEPATYYVVANDGIQQISELVARVFTANNSEVMRNPSAAIITSAPKVSPVELNFFPSKLPEFVQDNTVCATWSKEPDQPQAITQLKVSKDVPTSSRARTEMAPSISGGDGPSMDRFYAGPEGKGRLVQATDLNDLSATQGTVYYISPEGIRYSIGGQPEQTLQSLGVTATPFVVPWQHLGLIPEGATLSKTEALVLHETITPPEQQISGEKVEEIK